MKKEMKNDKGFSLIEILMVLILIAVLAAIAINAFINFRTEAKEAAIQADLKVLRTSIAAQYSQMQLRCASTPGVFPALASLNANDITDGNSVCTTLQVPIASERAFVQGGIPIPPTNTVGNRTAIACVGAVTGNTGCARGGNVACDGTTVFTDQWCYNPTTGDLWLDSSNATYESY